MTTRVIRADGTEKIVTPANGRSFTLAEMQAYVGGFIEVLLLGFLPDENGTPMMMVGNEEGKQKRLPVNQKASQLWWEGRGQPTGDVLLGDILVCRQDQCR